MKNIFMATAKLWGLYLIFNGILVFALAAAAPSIPRDTGTSFQWLRFGIPILTIVLGSCLIAYSEQLAKFVGITDATPTTSFSAEAFLRIGIILIGINYGTEIISGLVPKVSSDPRRSKNTIPSERLLPVIDVFAFGRTLQEVLKKLEMVYGDSIYSNYVKLCVQFSPYSGVPLAGRQELGQ